MVCFIGRCHAFTRHYFVAEHAAQPAMHVYLGPYSVADCVLRVRSQNNQVLPYVDKYQASSGFEFSGGHCNLTSFFILLINNSFARGSSNY